MKLSNLVSLIFLFLPVLSFATGETHFPIGIVDHGALSVGTSVPAASSAALDVVSTSKGFNPPRMTATQMNAIVSPTDGLTIYNTTVHSLYSYENGAWTAVGAGGSVAAIGTFDSQVASSEGLVISGQNLYGQSASPTVPGMINTGTQSFAGAKIFTGAVSTQADLGFFGTPPISQPSGDVLTALQNLGLLTSPTLSSSDIPNNAANTTGTAANITATTNSTLTTLSELALPYSQLTGEPTIYYQTVEINGTPVTQRSTLDFSSDFTIGDSTSPARTTVALSNPLPTPSPSAFICANGAGTGWFPCPAPSSGGGGTITAVQGVSPISVIPSLGPIPIVSLGPVPQNLYGTGIDTSASTGVLTYASGSPIVSSLTSLFINLWETVSMTAGDLIYSGTGGAPTVLPSGAPGNYLTQGTIGPQWSAPSTISTATWSGYTTAAVGGSVTSTSFVDITNVSLPVLNQTLNSNFGTVTQTASELGITVNFTFTGNYQVCATPMIQQSSTSTTVSARLVDGSGTIINPGLSNNSQSTSTTSSLNLCGMYAVTSTASPIDIKIQGAASTGTAYLGVVAGVSTTASVMWTITAASGAVAPGTIVASYGVTTTVAVSSGVQINYDTMLIDNTGGAVTTGAGVWKFQPNVPGNYLVGGTDFNASGSNIELDLYKNGSVYSALGNMNTSAIFQFGPIIVHLNGSTDYIDTRPVGSVTVQGYANSKYYSIINIQLATGGGNVSSAGTTGQSHIESALIAGATNGSSCTSDPCTIYGNETSWISAANWNSIGSYTLHFPAGEFSAAPICTTTFDGNTGSYSTCAQVFSSSTATSVQISCLKTTFASDNEEFEITCKGPH